MAKTKKAKSNKAIASDLENFLNEAETSYTVFLDYFKTGLFEEEEEEEVLVTVKEQIERILRLKYAMKRMDSAVRDQTKFISF